MGNRLPTCTECGDLRPLQPCKLPGPCEWQPPGCECNEDGGSRFFNDDDVLLERLEAASQGDRLLTKLHVNVALFSSTSSDIVEGLLQLTRQQQSWHCGDELSLHSALHQGLQQHARPPVSLMKALQWVYRVEEMPSPAANPARHCVLLFFSTMLAAAAALKWQKSPPAVWKRKGLQAIDILRTVESRLSEVIAALRFLACVALLQHCADPSMLGSKRTMAALIHATGIKVSVVQELGDQPLIPPKPNTPIVMKADTAWDVFFGEARRRPADAAASLLRDLHGVGEETQSRFLPGGPTHFSLPLVPQAALDTWDDELVYCPGHFEDEVGSSDAQWACSGVRDEPVMWSGRTNGTSARSEDHMSIADALAFGVGDEGVHVVVPL